MTHIRDLVASGPTLSFEFFPPKNDESARSLEKTLHELAPLRPSFVSVTYGAGGSDREQTRDLVVDLNATHPFPAMAHLTCVGRSRAEIRELLADYAANGVVNLLALAGDPPEDGTDPGGDFHFASELVELIRESGDFSVGVAAFPELHPRSETTRHDRDHLAAKLEAADFGITQFFFDPVPYFRMLDDLSQRGVSTQVLPGVMPVTNPVSIARFAAMNGTRRPPQLWNRLQEATPADRLEIAIEQASELARELLDQGAPGVHLYTLNRSEAALRIASNLGLG
ncbi:MAG: methylenetetrahydrofolate reductase [Acidimicrobiia bacterium]|nr:methylenetetrahydrofolate reductase [Acidimicrobiia bacterium]